MRVWLIAPVLLVAMTTQVGAGVMLQPISAWSNMGTTSGSPDAVRNQDGLSIGYTNLVTDFDAYVASGPTHKSDTPFTLWQSSSTTGTFDFDLGSTFSIESFALWNLGGNVALNVLGFSLLADDNSMFTSPTHLGSFVAATNTGPASAVLPEVFTFAPTDARFVRMDITSNNGAGFGTGFSEAAFETSAVPEPSSLVICLSGLAATVISVRVRRRPRRR